MNILFLLTGFNSYDEAILISQFIDQIDENHDCSCLSQILPASYINTNPRIATGMFCDDKDINSQNLQKLFDKHKFDLIIWGDIINFLLEGEPFNFSLNWIKDINIPLCILDYQDVLNIEKIETNKHLISLNTFDNNIKKSHEFSLEHSNKIYIIKICPPSKYQSETNNPQLLYWQNLEEFPLVSKYNLREEIDKNFNFNENTKLIFLIFNPATILRSSVLGNSFKPDVHYEIVTNLVCYYLKILMNNNKNNCQLFITNYPRVENRVAGASLPVFEKDESFIHIKEIPLLTHALYTTLLKASDLIITECNWQPALISAITMEVPSIVLGSNVAIKEENGVKQIVSDYTDMDMYVYQCLETLLKNNPDSIFPYISYPHEIQFLPNINMVQNGYFYHITDIFNDERTVALFFDLLCNKEYQDYLQTLYLPIKENNKNALLAEKIVEIVTHD